MLYFLEHFGATVAAITGVLAARGKSVDLFGVIVLASVTALGGGTVRDLCLGQSPMPWVADPSYLVNSLITAVVVFYLVRYHELSGTVLMVSDAFALALYTVVGAQRAIACGSGPVVTVTMGVITGVAGGILRDLLLGEIPMVFRQEICLYATAAVGGALFYVGMMEQIGDEQMNMIAATIVTLALRLAGIRWRITLPMFRPKNKTPAQS
jgi:uncharacterized membrane protein YeiH